MKQSQLGKYISREKLKKGDLIFFDTSKKRKGYVNHVGIYLGNGKFIHANSITNKIELANLDLPYYKERYKMGKRVIGENPL